MKIGDIVTIEEDNIERSKMVLGKSHKIVLWKRWYREVSTVENKGQHNPQACCKLYVLEETT